VVLYFSRLADKEAPFLEAVAWNQYERPFQTGYYSVFCETGDKILSAFSTIKNGHAPSI
jgi:hypothetical protein